MKRPLPDARIDALERLLGRDAVRVDAASCRDYGTDWAALAEPDPAAVVFPRTAEQVQALLVYANEWRWPLVPSGGRTGLAGGALAARGEIVVSLEKMNRITAFDAADRLLVCEPGVVTAQVQQFAREQGLYYAVEFGADGSSQVGGNIATNAGGVRVLRYGMTRAQVAGLQVVTGTAALVDDMRCLHKDNAGYALRELFIGSEGTLGIVTQAGLRLHEAPPPLATALLLLDGHEILPAVLQALQPFGLHACELMARVAWELGRAGQAAVADVPPAAWYLLVEAPAEAMTAAALVTALSRCAVADVLLAQSTRQAAAFWAVRESITAALKPQRPLKFDIGFRLSVMPAVLAALAAQWPDAVVYGHLGDGNLHLNITGSTDAAATQARVWALVKHFHGTITAEHGIGLLRREAFAGTEGQGRLQVIRQLKQALDPQGILNPDKLLPHA